MCCPVNCSVYSSVIATRSLLLSFNNSIQLLSAPHPLLLLVLTSWKHSSVLHFHNVVFFKLLCKLNNTFYNFLRFVFCTGIIPGTSVKWCASLCRFFLFLSYISCIEVPQFIDPFTYGENLLVSSFRIL